MLDQRVTKDHGVEIDRFMEVRYKEQILQTPIKRLFLMFHKPRGILSATTDKTHRTVLDFIDCPDKETLHLAGRLDRSSTGLILLTNDGRWSESLTDPHHKVKKRYQVETDQRIPEKAVRLFREGFDFPTEGIRTRPAMLKILAPCQAEVVIEEGRYHQIKRMFHRIDGIRLRSLHRDQIGRIMLPQDLEPGQWRPLTAEEIRTATT
ncbi:MAG: pseudouridine synthase [Verrucomicrobiales bacterium]|nr:pseudouridine synthase [Verrucomicrobiales bacterium]